MSKRPIKHLTPQQAAVIEKLNQIRAHLPGAKTEQDFARRYLPFSYDTWRHLRLDDYTGSVDKCCADAEKALANILLMIEARVDTGAGKDEFFPTSISRAIFNAVDAARGRDNENRLIIYKSETGGGKSAICRQLARKYDSPIVEGTESMRTSYFAVCSRICKAYGSPGPWMSKDRVEDEMLAIFGQRDMVLIFDEGNSFGPQAINALKLLLNRTRATIFIAAIPAIFNRMRLKSWFEASQLIRRVEAVFVHPDFDRVHVAPFFNGWEFPDGQAKAMNRIAEAASAFGLYDMVKRVREELVKTCGGKTATQAQIETALNIAETKTEAYRLLIERRGK
jgi:hypothetical protein